MSLSPGTFIVTGAAGGLGRAVAEIYSKGNHPYTGIFTVRDGSTQSAHDLQKLLSSSGRSLTTAVVDLSDLSSVRKFASDIKSKVQSGELKPIRALLLNAGTQDITGMKFTSDGLEHTFVVNYLANVLLVLLLLPSIDRENGRIVFVSSSAHDPTHWLNKNFKPDAIAWKEPGELARPTVPDQEGDERNAGLRRYGTSKLWLLMFMSVSIGLEELLI
jgi:NAD(P)-dependent dehydrogenase (short-subunit alcohol dehydrogenase family)